MDLIIIGATSNICRIRVFENLNQIQGMIKEIKCVSRKHYSQEKWNEYLSSISIKEMNLLDRIHYVQCDYKLSEYQQILAPLIHQKTVIYISTPPCCYKELIEFVNLIDKGTLVLEKPLSLNYQQYLELKPIISPRVHMIDHFLYKYDVQHIISEFQGPLNSIHFRFLYTDDVENRLGYFDNTGFFIDMFQSHFLSILYYLIQDEIEILKKSDIEIDRKQYDNYGGQNPEADTYFYLRISYQEKVFIFEAGKAMSKFCKEIFVNEKKYSIHDYKNEYSLFFTKIPANNNLVYTQETFWEITEHVKKYFNDIGYYPRNDYSGTLEDNSDSVI